MKREAYIALIEVRDLRAKVYPIFKTVCRPSLSGHLRPRKRPGRAHRIGIRLWPERFSPSDLDKLVAHATARGIEAFGVPEYLMSYDPGNGTDKTVAQLWQRKGQDLHLLKSIELTSIDDGNLEDSPFSPWVDPRSFYRSPKD